MVGVVTEELGDGKRIEVGFFHEGGKSALEVRQSDLVNEDFVERLNEEGAGETCNNRSETFVDNARGIRHHGTHLGNDGLRKLDAFAETFRSMSETGVS